MRLFRLIYLHLVIAAIAGFAVSTRAQTLVDRADGSLTTIAAWDFNGGNASTVASVNARYSQQYSPYFTAGTASAPGDSDYGTVSFTSAGGVGATFGGNRSLASSNAPTYDLLSTDGLLVSNNSLGDNSTNARSILLSTTAAQDTARAVFKLDTLTSFDRFEDINLAYSARNQGSADATISWSYSIDGGFTFVPITGTTASITPSGAAYGAFTADLSAVSAIEGRSDILLGLEYSESAAGASVFLDNVAIYGTAAPLATPPTIEDLTDQAVLLGANVTFSPTINNAGASPTYQWQSSPLAVETWTAIAAANTATLTLLSVGPEDFIRYRLVVTNPLNNTSATSVAATLSQALPPAIVTEGQPQPLTVNPGQSAAFTVSATGTPVLSYQWFKGADALSDGALINGSTTASLTLSDVQMADLGSYFVRVTNAYGTVDSSTVLLTVLAGNVAPTIQTPPQGVTANAGGEATFQVVASGTPAPTYRWRRAGVDLADGPDISGSGTAELRLTNLTAASAGEYTVFVENTVGDATSNPAVLNVLFRPEILVGGQPQSATVNVSESVTFTVSAIGNPAPTYQWRKGTATLNGQTGASLTLDNVTLADAGDYSVVVTNSRGSVTSATARLTVLSPPVITTQPANQAVLAGGSASFRVVAQGVPAVSYQWRKDGEAIPGATGASLDVSPVSAANAGVYTVVVSNSAGSRTSDPATLSVGYQVVRQRNGVAQQVQPGARLVFPTGVTGTNLRYQWYRNGKAIAGATAATYEVAAAGTADAGVYVFKAFAPNGRVLINHAVGRVVVSRAANFTVLLRDPVTDEPVGLVELQVAANLGFTGRVVYEDRKTYSFRGTFLAGEGEAAASVTILSGQTARFALGLVYDFTDLGLTAELTPAASAEVLGEGAAFPRTTTAAWAGRYNLALTPVAPVPEGQPSAVVNMSVTVATSAGRMTVTGRLSDGTPYTSSGNSDIAAGYAFYNFPYAKLLGYVGGELRLVSTNTGYVARVAESGEWFWYKPAAGSSGEIDLRLAPALAKP